MRKVIFFVSYLVLCMCTALPAELNAKDKYADLSGSWYKSSPASLQQELSEYIGKAKVPKLKGTVLSVIAPHAGFSYSGGVATHSFKAMQAASPKTVIIVGFTHLRHFPGTISVLKRGAFITPLGKAEIDPEVTDKLLAFDPAIRNIPEAFDSENSIEMLVPLAQIALPEAKFVLVAISDQDMTTADILAEALSSVMLSDKGVVAVASTDMCHHLPQKEAVQRDSGTIEKLRMMDPNKFYLYSLQNNHELMCGWGAVYAVMKASIIAGADSFEVLKYATSGDVFSDNSRVVGYLSAAFLSTKERVERESVENEEIGMFSKDEKKMLLELARSAIEQCFRTGGKPDFQIKKGNLMAPLGGFVTLHKNGSLRGCVGQMRSEGPFYETVMDMAVEAAFRDSRFQPVREDELDTIDIEISALSPMRKISDHGEIEIGKHGVMVVMGTRSGVYLPQVALETGWTKEEFMDSLCAHKAGIPRDAWRTKEAEIYVFTAEVFSEKGLE